MPNNAPTYTGTGIITVTDANYPDGTTGPAYAVVSFEDGRTMAAACTVRRAMDLQRAGARYHGTMSRDSLDSWFPPDFPPIR